MMNEMMNEVMNEVIKQMKNKNKKTINNSKIYNTKFCFN